MTNENKLFSRIPYTYLIRGIWSMLLLFLFTFFGLFIYVANTRMPDTQELENPKFEVSTIVYSSDGVELDRYFRRNRQWVKFDQLSQNLIDALIATEDYRFFHHSGIDARGTARAVAYLGSRGGASTITQQLAKQFFTQRRSRNFGKRVWQKMKEWVIAIEFERRYTKEEILAMFLNKFDFNFQANGIGAAANIYFGKDQKDLTVPEAATLIGMLKNPILYSPVNAQERSANRRNVVLNQMAKYEFISDAECENYKNEPIDISNFSRGENYKGQAPHFMAELKKYVRKVFDENNITKPGGEPYNLDTDGLKIYTTIDSKMQAHAEAAAKAQMKIQQDKFAKVWSDKDPWEYYEYEKNQKPENLENQKAVRHNKLTELIERTELYQSMRHKSLGNSTARIIEEVPDARLWNGDIYRLLKGEEDSGYFAELIENNYISQLQKDTYIKVLNSEHWRILKSKWYTLRDEVKGKFNEKRLTKVFDYDGEREVIMSPIDSIKYMSSILQIGSLSVDPLTGHVKTWVGGSNYEYWKYDHVTSNRQVGSTFKPFLYTAAINNAISPCWKILDRQYVIPAGEEPFKLLSTWSPQNSRGKFSNEEVTLKEALKQSLNSASVYLVKELGTVSPIIEVAEIMGIEEGKIPNYPSIVLGTPSLSVFEMTRAYTTFANNGVSSNPIFIKTIEDNGVIIYEEQTEQHRALSPAVNYAMVNLLQHATSAVQYQLESEFGGKTGTTNDHVDAWFMGVTPELVTGTWVGGEYNWIRFLSLNEGQGSRMARPYFIDFMKRIESDPQINVNTNSTFIIPDDVGIELNCEEYEQFVPDSANVDEIEMLDEFN